MTKLIFIGPAGGGKHPTNGASAKNRHLLDFLVSKGIKTSVIDTEFWKTQPWILIKIVLFALFHRNANYIVAANNSSSYRLLQILRMFRIKHITYWVIGGSVANWIKDGRLNADLYRKLDNILVEGTSMKRTFEEMGFTNARYVPNFKNIPPLPDLAKRPNREKTHFVFLSRIIPEKGCDIIIEAAKALNKAQSESFIVDFYGPFDENYKPHFLQAISCVENIEYKGFLNLSQPENYGKLAEYDCMLFPTYWHGEGFPGIIIDAYISGLPIIASDHSFNTDLVENGNTGLIIESQNAQALANAMLHVIEHKEKFNDMHNLCQAKALDFSTERVLSDALLESIGIL